MVTNSSASPRVLVCYSHLRWNFVFQRPQHLIGRACKEFETIYFEEPIRADIDACREQVTEYDCGVSVVTPLVPNGLKDEEIVDAQRAMLERLIGGCEAEAIFWYYTPMALSFSAHLEPSLIVYDCMDELSAFKGAPRGLIEAEAQLLARADLVFTGGHSLFEAKRHKHRNVHVFPSSIDQGHFQQARARPRPEPEDQASIPLPRIGFFGVIDERMDLGLVEALAALRPEWHFVMIGPVAKIDPSSLPRAPNLHWLGQKTYHELPRYLGGWQAGFMPFALNEATRFISPTKTPEFLAAGLPVVSTPIADVQHHYGAKGMVSIAHSPAEASAALAAALRGPSASWIDRVDGHIAALSWDKTYHAMRGLMREALRGHRLHAPLLSEESAAHV
jgi:glycosyltransferase involved in cell wall biosynthesis